MMLIAGYLLYPAMAIILLWMWKGVRGRSLEDIVHKSAREHHQLITLFKAHPKGGSWPAFSNWISEVVEADRSQFKA